MQRGVGREGLCCINCMPQYAVSERGPPPVPVPPPPPLLACNISTTIPQACFNTSGLSRTVLPNMALAGRDSDRLSLKGCASECSFAWNWTGSRWAGYFTNATIAGVEVASLPSKHKSATDRCACGSVAALTTAEAKRRARPMAECTGKLNCTGDKLESCGAVDRLLTYGFECKATAAGFKSDDSCSTSSAITTAVVES